MKSPWALALVAALAGSASALRLPANVKQTPPAAHALVAGSSSKAAPPQATAEPAKGQPKGPAPTKR